MNDERIFLGLGSNLGEREGYLSQARARLEGCGKISLIDASSLYETAPVGVIDQPAFLNQVLEVRSGLMPEELLEKILEIEKSLGRERKQRWGPRTIDIDLLSYGGRQIASERLTLPHPEAHRRRFVLVPWAEIAPEFWLATFAKTVNELLIECVDQSKVRMIER
jgi:2-amino-4-hydroxy-6-hydroxymethyldihydropteridine diphosphokinase